MLQASNNRVQRSGQLCCSDVSSSAQSTKIIVYLFSTFRGLDKRTKHTGWASYFLDHSGNLPGQPATVLKGPPAHCSYARGPLLEVGGFPEDMRAGEDTVVNMALVRRGYVAYRDPQIQFTHHSPCRTPWRLVRHHFTRGRGLGRILLEGLHKRGASLDRTFLRERYLRYLPSRLERTTRGVMRAGPEYRRLYIFTFPLVVAGAIAAWLGMWYEILQPSPRKLRILLSRRAGVLLGWYS